MENKHGNDSYIYSQENRELGGFLRIGQLVSAQPRPILSLSLQFHIQSPFTPQNLWPDVRPPRRSTLTRLTQTGRAAGAPSARPPPRTRWKPRAAQLLISGTPPGGSPEGRAPTRNLCAWGRPGSRARLLPPAAAPSPARAQRGTEPAVRAGPWRRQAQSRWGSSLRVHVGRPAEAAWRGGV